jgi:predicted TIM-barrel fold metal-dependent hydrolase
MREYRLIDSDAHALEAPNIWKNWLPAQFQDRAPRLVKDPAGGDAWQFEPDRPIMMIGLTATAGMRYEEMRWEGYTFETIRKSCYDGAARLEDMDFDGIDAECLYPSQRTMQYFMGNEEVEFHRAGIRAYNDWLMKEFCAPDPTRLIGLAQTPNLGTDEAIAELRRCKDMGYLGAIISAWPSGNDFLGPEDDPFWSAAEEMGLPISVHINVVRRNQAQPTQQRSANVGMGGQAGAGSDVRAIAQMAFAGLMAFPSVLSELIMSGTFERHPKLKIIGTEVEVGWIPEAIEQLDNFYWRNRTWTKLNLKKLPSEYFHENFLCTFITDRFGVKSRYEVGVRNMAWSTDFPHHGNDWPYSRKIVEELFAGVPEYEKWLITCGNTGLLYGLIEPAQARERALATVGV